MTMRRKIHAQGGKWLRLKPESFDFKGKFTFPPGTWGFVPTQNARKPGFPSIRYDVPFVFCMDSRR
jgi:hypothetical protein